ncbi:MAG: haloacid dehalogenase type II, partial [Hyphomicrobiaceae bacterium]
ERLAMENLEVLKREAQVLIFDLYGTVVDMQSGLTEAVTPFLQQKGWTGSPSSFVTWWRRTHFEDSLVDALLDRGHTPYRRIGHRAVGHVLERCAIAHTQDDVTELVACIERLKPFADVVPALEKLARRYKSIVLSNGDRDMLDAAKPHIGFSFDLMISVQEAGFFKPHPAAYTAAERIVAGRWPHVERSGCLFVANHPFDCIGAKAYGFRTVFVNRRKRPFGQSPCQPDLVVPDFAGLADALA